MPFCIAYATKKRILIIHAYDTAEVPLSIVEPENFGQDRDCDIPICLVYSKTHYDSVHPVGKHIEKSIELFDQTKLDRQCTFLPSTDVKSMLGPLTKAEKMSQRTPPLLRCPSPMCLRRPRCPRSRSGRKRRSRRRRRLSRQRSRRRWSRPVVERRCEEARGMMGDDWR